jgi:hypothetical protein
MIMSYNLKTYTEQLVIRNNLVLCCHFRMIVMTKIKKLKSFLLIY